MRTTLAAGLVFLSTLGFDVAVAETVEIPVPELCGAYSEDGVYERTAGFDLGRPPVVVHGAWVRLTGDASVGTVVCEGGGSYPWVLDFSAVMIDSTTGGRWLTMSSMPETPGPFSFTADFWPTPRSTTTWNFLLDGRGEVTLYGAPMPLVGLCGPVTPAPEGVVEEAVLIVDADFPIPVENNTWGHIKALYRTDT